MQQQSKDSNAFWCSNFSKMLPERLRRAVSFFAQQKDIGTKQQAIQKDIGTKHQAIQNEKQSTNQHFAYFKKTKCNIKPKSKNACQK